MKELLFGFLILLILCNTACLPSGHEENFIRLTDQNIPGRVTNADNEQQSQNEAPREIAIDESAKILIKIARVGTGNVFKSKITFQLAVEGKDLTTIGLNMLDSKDKMVSAITAKAQSGETVTVSTMYDRVNTKWFELILINETNQIIARRRRPAN